VQHLLFMILVNVWIIGRFFFILIVLLYYSFFKMIYKQTITTGKFILLTSLLLLSIPAFFNNEGINVLSIDSIFFAGFFIVMFILIINWLNVYIKSKKEPSQLFKVDFLYLIFNLYVIILASLLLIKDSNYFQFDKRHILTILSLFYSLFIVSQFVFLLKKSNSN
jgi:hypothetical protein